MALLEPAARYVRSAWIRQKADPGVLARGRRRAETARLREGRPHDVHYFHQIDDPYSQLVVQVLERFGERFDVRLLPHVVAEPTPAAIHDPVLWNALCRRECAAMAPFYGLEFGDGAETVEPSAADLSRRILLNCESQPEFVSVAVAVGAALRRGDRTALEGIALRMGAAAPAESALRLQANFDLRHRMGHYLGAMFFQGCEWYWGIDRLHFLEARLDALGARRSGAPDGPSAIRLRRSPPTLAGREAVRVEFFASLRSPYTHLAYGQIADLCRRYPLDLVCRPVLPMMMRGVKADRRKSEYIIRDTKREADRMGEAFGNACDPFGNPVRRGYSLFPWARDQGKAFEYLYSFSRAVWGEGLNAGSRQGLRRVVERAGLSWAEAVPLIDNRDWEAELEANVTEMIGAGSWGVPTLRLPAAGNHPEFTVWGQDRIWLVEEAIARRLGR